MSFQSTAQSDIAGAAPLMIVPPNTVTGQSLRGRPANRLDQVTIAWS
jgi:hypothetical protein